jgi:hypothetical protein
MSLTCLALRLITRRALEGRTLADDRIRDSELAPLSTILNGPGDVTTGPVISLYIDQTRAEMSGREWMSAKPSAHLLIEIAADTSISEENIEIPATSAGLETTLDLIAYQVRVALLGGATPWSDLWSKLVSSIASVDTLRGAEFQRTGTRFAARQLDLDLGILNDPVPGAIIWPWDEIIAAFAADPEFDEVAVALQAVIAGQPVPAWRRGMMEVGDTVSDAIAMGYGPLGGGATDPLVPVVEVDVRQAVPGAPDTLFAITPAEEEPDAP